MIVNNIKEARIMRGVSQSELAEHLETDQATISKIENGKRDTSGQRLCKIADYLDVSVDYLLKRI